MAGFKRYSAKRTFKKQRKFKRVAKHSKGIAVFMGEKTLLRKFVITDRLIAAFTNGQAAHNYALRNSNSSFCDIINDFVTHAEVPQFGVLYEYLQITGISIKIATVVNMALFSQNFLGTQVLNWPMVSFGLDYTKVNVGAPLNNYKLTGNFIEYQVQSTSQKPYKKYIGLPDNVQAVDSGLSNVMAYGHNWFNYAQWNAIVVPGAGPRLYFNVGMDRQLTTAANVNATINLDLCEVETTVYTRWGKRI